MAVTQPTDFSPSQFVQDKADLSNYADLGSYIDEILKPDNREALVKTYGSQLVGGIEGLLSMVGAKKGQSTSNEVTYWEDTRLHKTQDGTIAAITPTDSGAKIVTSAGHTMKVGDAALVDGYIRAYVSATTSGGYTLIPYGATWGVTKSSNAAVKVIRFGAEFAQGSNQPTEFESSNIVKRTNPHMIFKMVYAVKGSDMTNLSWVKDPSTGKNLWYLKQADDQETRYRNYKEMLHVLGAKAENTTLSGASFQLNGSEGLFEAVENRGIVNGGYIEDLADIDEIVKALDAQGGASEYAGYFNNTQMLKFSDLAATSAGLAKYGMFDNKKDLAISLDFKSIERGGITFHNHKWDLMNDPTLLGHTDYYKGVMIPMDTVVDAKTGDRNPCLEINHKEANGYSREREYWMTGAVNGIYTDGDGKDQLTMNWRSESNLVTRAANRFVMISGS